MSSVEKLAVVSTVLASAKVTVPKPLTFDQVVTSADGLGSPSSVTVPSRLAEAGSVIVWSVPAVTFGGRFTGSGLTVTVMSSLTVNSVSSAVRRKV